MTTVTYVPNEPPRDLGTDCRGSQALFGVYRVDYDDGFHVWFSHTAYTHTISAEPVDLDAEPEFRELLLRQADKIKADEGEVA